MFFKKNDITNKNKNKLTLYKNTIKKTTELMDTIVLIKHFAQAGETNPYRSSIVKYLSLYIRFITNISRFAGPLYISGSYKTQERGYHSTRNDIYHTYKHIFPRFFYRQVHIFEALFMLIYYKNMSYMISYLKEMFSTVNFFKHRYLLYYFRAAFLHANGIEGYPNVNGLFIKFRGKLAKAGNSRRQKFIVSYGHITTNQSDNYMVEKFQIKTFTGAIGCSIVFSYK